MKKNDAELADCLAAQQDASACHLHELEAADVRISEEAVSVIRSAAKKILARYASVESLARLTLGDAASLFSKRIFWNEENGKLLMCSQLAEGSVCLPIPPEHWSVRDDRPSQ